VSVAFNIGVPRYCASTAAKRFNAGNYAGGCEALTWFKYAGGKVVKGLANRRAREYKVCVGGLGAL
jgi:lysozyme